MFLIRLFTLVGAFATIAATPFVPPPIGAEACTGCHVKNGGPGLLLGRPAADTARMMDAFRTGRQPGTIMGRIVKGFTQDEVQQLSLWFANQ